MRSWGTATHCAEVEEVKEARPGATFLHSGARPYSGKALGVFVVLVTRLDVDQPSFCPCLSSFSINFSSLHPLQPHQGLLPACLGHLDGGHLPHHATSSCLSFAGTCQAGHPLSQSSLSPSPTRSVHARSAFVRLLESSPVLTMILPTSRHHDQEDLASNS
jgi:hypothetical protein